MPCRKPVVGNRFLRSKQIAFLRPFCRETADRIRLFGSFPGDGHQGPKTIDEILEVLADAHRNVASFIRRRFIYRETPPVPISTFDLDALKRVIRIVKKTISALTDSSFVVLLDEYENLFPYQQRIINGFIKLAPPQFSVKVAKKLGSRETSGSTTGQELQETHDYTRLTLVYDVEDTSHSAPITTC